MNKNIFTLIVFFAFVANVSAQIEVNTSEQVGIGTKNPQHKLHVVGNTFVTGNIYLGTTANSLSITGNNPLTFKVNNIISGLTGSSGNSNVAFGYCAFNSNTEGTYNTAIGFQALRFNETGNCNTATGASALRNNITGYQNTASGYAAL